MKSIKKVTVKKAQSGSKVPKSKQNPVDEYKGMKDAKGKPIKNMGGEGRRAPFKSGGKVMKGKKGC